MEKIKSEELLLIQILQMDIKKTNKKEKKRGLRRELLRAVYKKWVKSREG